MVYAIGLDKRVSTRTGQAQWRVDQFVARSKKKTSESFKMGVWDWHMSVEMGDTMSIRLFPVLSENSPPLARVFLNVAAQGNNKCIVHEGVISSAEDFVFLVDLIRSSFIITVDFWSLQKPSDDKTGEYIPVFPSDRKTKSTMIVPNCFTRMLKDCILADVTINTCDGTLHAHKFVLSASSAVFEKMFEHDLKEKKTSTIEMKDITSESCAAFLDYIYGCVEYELFWHHRWYLLAAASKYDVPELIDECEKSLSNDINLDNVFERFEEAVFYDLKMLKEECFKYLVELKKKYDITKQLEDFCATAHKDLVVKLFLGMIRRV